MVRLGSEFPFFSIMTYRTRSSNSNVFTPKRTNNGNITVVFGVHSCRKETIRTKLILNYVGFSFKSWFGRLKKSILIDLLA
ncbi:hypothetical protein LEP1GSC070_0105 [Leptospira santarosai str. AIM]|nr:hypothetical protein LEP1GSC070_0105 [Leptospira santarosai str. AIM]